jgi:hypothetical protein
MRTEDLYPGLTVRIIDFNSNVMHRPDHWAEEGEMDEWQGEIVTIRSVDQESEYVIIEEDDGSWQWYPWDFDPYVNLGKDDPNVQYKQQKAAKEQGDLTELWKKIAKDKYGKEF